MPESDEPVAADPHRLTVRIEWHQDRSERRVRLSGVIDARTVRHLVNALVGLGDRRLYLDLRLAVPAAGFDLGAFLEELRRRLGSRPIVVDGEPGPGADPPST